MSTESIELSTTTAPAVVSLSHPPAAGTTAIETVPGFLVTLCAIRPEDRVMVIGRHLSEHLVALAHSGCREATGGDPSTLYMRKDTADVVWITGVGEIDAEVAGVLSRMARLRLVAIDVASSAPVEVMTRFLQRLRQLGFLRLSQRKMAGRRVLVAYRVGKLQWAA